MKVLYDGQAFSIQEYGGVSQYFCQLIKAFANMEGMSTELVVKYSNNVFLNELNVTTRSFFRAYKFKGRNEIIKFLNRIYFKKVFSGKKSEVSLFHPTYYHPYFLRFIGRIPFVLTVHDMTHEYFPHIFSKFDNTSKHKAQVALYANRIIAVSENTKKDIIRILNVPEKKIDVIYHGPTLSLNDISSEVFALPENFILYVGRRDYYKNFLFLLSAFKDVLSKSRNLNLICAGGGHFKRKELQEISKLQLQESVIQVDINKSMLAYLYSKAKAFVFPSLYEGFGMPILDAFACGCPVLLSNKSSFPEVGGEAAKYFDPEDRLSLVNVLIEVLENKTLADSMRNRGLERVKFFSWETAAVKTLETYKKAVS